MNFNNIYLLDHQQISSAAAASATAGYRTLSNPVINNSGPLNQPLAPIKTSISMQSTGLNTTNLPVAGETDKVIFKIESDHLTNSTSLPNFKLNYTFTNHQIGNQTTHINNINNINNNNNTSQDLKQFRMAKDPNVSPAISTTQLNNNNLITRQHIGEVIRTEKAELVRVEPTVVDTAALESLDPNALNIYVNNVVCSYSTRCHLNLRRIAMEGMHVEYKKENGMVNMKLRKPYTTATMWSSGKVTCAGAKSEADAYIAARRFCRMLQKMQFKVKMTNYRVVNVLATCNMPFGVDIQKLSENYQKECSYEPELHPGATFKLLKIKATLKLFTTGSITLTAPSVLVAKEAINQIYPILLEFKRTFPAEQMQQHLNNNISNQMISKIESNFTTQILQQQKGFQGNSYNKNTCTIKAELHDYKPPVQSTFSNFSFYSNLQSNFKQITKTIGTPTITSISSLNHSTNNPNEPSHITNINQLSKNQQSKPVVSTISGPNQIYQVNLPSTYHQIIPSNTLHSYTQLSQPAPPNGANNNNNNSPLFVPTITSNGNSINNNINISSSLLNTIQTASPHIHNQHSSIQQTAFSNNLNSISNNSTINSNSNMSILSSNTFSNTLANSSSSILSQPSNGWYYDSLLVDNVDDFLP